MKLLVALAENGDAEDVRRQQIGRELDALELRVNGFGERLGQRRLARAGKILQQDVAAGGERGEQLPRGTGLAAHDFGNIGRDFFAGVARGVKAGRCHGRVWRLKQRGRGKVS